MENKANKYLGQEKIPKLLLKFAIPCVLSLLISALYNIVDQIFIGNSKLGYLGNAATSVVYPITIIAMAFAFALGDGSAAFLSICQGRKDTKNSHRAVGNSSLVCLIISIIFVVVGLIFKDNLLYLFGASETSIGLARAYFTIILSFMPAYMLGTMLNSVIRADGAPGFAMVAMLTGAITNIVLDPIFIYAFDWASKVPLGPLLLVKFYLWFWHFSTSPVLALSNSNSKASDLILKFLEASSNLEFRLLLPKWQLLSFLSSAISC